MEIRFTKKALKVKVEVTSELTGCIYSKWETMVSRKMCIDDIHYLDVCKQTIQFLYNNMKEGDDK